MAKRELRRKVLATIATVFVMCCGLALCIWLLLTSEVFSSTIRWLMLACTVGLGIATLGLLVCKIQEIRTLSKLVKKEAELPQQPEDTSEPQQPELQPLQILDEPLPPIEQAAPPQPEPEQPAVPVMAPAPQPAPTVHTPQPEEAPPPVEQHHWQPINFKAVDQQYKSAQVARVKAMEEARNAQEQARRMAEQARSAQAEAPSVQPVQTPQPVQAAAPAAQPSREELLLQRAQQQQQARRAEQIRLADEARTGQLPRITNEMIAQEEARLAALARQAEAQRLAQSTAPAPAPQEAVPVAAQPAPVAPQPAASSAPQTAAPQPAAVQQAPAQQWGQAWSAPHTEPRSAEPQQVAEPEHPVHTPIAWPTSSKPARTTQLPKITDDMVAAAKNQNRFQTAARTGQLPKITDDMVAAAKSQSRFQTAARTGQLPKITDDMVAAAKSQNRFQTAARTGQLPKITDDMVAAAKTGKPARPVQTLGNFAAHYQKGSQSADSYWKSQNKQ